MSVRLVRPQELGAAETAAWARLQDDDPAFASPFFCPEFTQVVGSVRDDVRVAVLEGENGPVGFFPFQRTGRLGLGDPVGGGRSNAQGLVAARGLEWSAPALVRACRLRAWRFHHLLAEQRPFQAYHETVMQSPYMDLSDGFEAYAAARKAAGSSVLSQAGRKARKMERELGPLRFEAQVDDRAPLEAMMRWKSDQYRRTGQVDRFASRWNVELLERIHATRTPAFAGMLSVLWAGDRLAAVHMGMRSRDVWHYWFPTYDPELGPYSPGQVMLARMAEAAPGLGLRTIDLGLGDAVYKERFMTGAVPLARGTVAPAAVRLARRAADGAESLVRRSPLMPVARSAARFARTRLGFLRTP
jgi:CelD/BcsL family acetyltransferase involved in cellulose biosynthesis